LEVVRRDLVEDQRQFYEQRARRHRGSAGLTSMWTGLSLALSGVASAGAITVVFGVGHEWLLVVGVLAAAANGYASDRESLYRDRGNADLYERTADKLSALEAGTDRVAAEIDAGNPQAVVGFTDLVAEELQVEHRQWVTGLDVTSQLLARLEERLREA